MKFIITNYEYIPGPKFTLAVTWDRGYTEYFDDWPNYPYAADFSKIKPRCCQNTSGLTFFKADPKWSSTQIRRENVQNFTSNPATPKSTHIPTLLEQYADELQEANSERLLYPTL